MSDNKPQMTEPAHKSNHKPVQGKRKTPPQSIKSSTPSKMQKTCDDTHTESIIGTAHSPKHHDDDDDDREEGEKWTTLEHHGLRFVPPYEPHGVPIIHKGTKIVLEPEEEEIANYWAQAFDTDFGQKEAVLKNFEKAFLKAMNPRYEIKSLAD